MALTRSLLWGGLLLLAGLMIVPTLTSAQDAPQGDRRTRPTPEQMRERMAQFMRERLGASEEEWEVLGPRLEKVQTLSREIEGNRFGGRRGRDGEAQPVDPNASELVKARAALSELLRQDNPDATALATALKTFRTARDAAKVELAKAQEQLREVLSVKQEAQLVMMGVLE